MLKPAPDLDPFDAAHKLSQMAKLYEDGDKMLKGTPKPAIPINPISLPGPLYNFMPLVKLKGPKNFILPPEGQLAVMCGLKAEFVSHFTVCR
jgi:hypothetical protein